MLTAKMIEALATLAGGFVNLLIPRFCLLCGPGHEADGAQNLCVVCTESLRVFPPMNQCRVCAKPLSGIEAARCRCVGCYGKRVPWNGILALGHFDGTLATMIRRLKYEPQPAFAATLGELMSDQVRLSYLSEIGFDVLIPMPLSPRRRRERGFNQSMLLAKESAKVLNIPILESYLRRVGPETSQVSGGAAKRRRLTRSAFEASTSTFGKRVLLLDDVVTTQSTLKAASLALKDAGVLSIHVVVCARTHLKRMGT